MRMNKILAGFMIMLATLTGFFSVSAQAAPQNDPVALLQYIADNMIAGLKTNKASLKTKPTIVYDLAYKYVVPYADIEEMSKRVLSPTVWKSATPAQRTAFKKQFTKTLIRTYASALTAYQDQSVKFFPVRGGFAGNKTVEVNGQITSSSSSPIRVSYRLMSKGSAWRLYDMSVEGVDMLDSFRSQYASILSQGNMDTLLSRISTHNDR